MGQIPESSSNTDRAEATLLYVQDIVEHLQHLVPEERIKGLRYLLEMACLEAERGLRDIKAGSGTGAEMLGPSETDS